MIGQHRGFRHRRAGGERQRQRRHHGVARAGDVRHFAATEVPHLRARLDSHMPCSPRVTSAASHPSHPKLAGHLAGLLVAALTPTGGRLGLELVRRDEGRAGIAREMWDLGVDDEWKRASVARGPAGPRASARDDRTVTPPFR